MIIYNRRRVETIGYEHAIWRVTAPFFHYIVQHHYTSRLLHALIWHKNNALHIGYGLQATTADAVSLWYLQCKWNNNKQMCVMSASQLWHESLFYSFHLSGWVNLIIPTSKLKLSTKQWQANVMLRCTVQVKHDLLARQWQTLSFIFSFSFSSLDRIIFNNSFETV